MWAFSKKQAGFTIVELLIVIIVIAILAGIVLVAYNGVRRQTVESAMASETSELKRRVDAYLIENDTYPTSITLFRKNTNDWYSFQYSYDNASEPKYYCLTATSKDTTKTFFASSRDTAKQGICEGHVASGTPSYTFQNLTWGALANRPVASAPSALATNQDGKITYVAYSGGSIYKSVNGGTSWAELPAAGTRAWSSIATSDDGQKIIAAASGLSGTGRNVVISLDGGANWQEQTALSLQNWTTVAVSGDGSRFMAGYEIGHLYMSANNGTSWSTVTAASSTRRWKSITLSQNGQKVYASSACETNSGFGTSSDGAATFAFRTAVPNCASQMVTSSDGQKALINGGTSSGTVYYTNDGGATWQDWSSVIVGERYGYAGISGDGTKMILDSTGKYVRISKDSGTTWTNYSTNTGGTTAGDDPRGAIVSRDGSAFYTYTINGIFKGQFD